MSSINLSKIKPLLVKYVKNSAGIIELHWDPYLKDLNLDFDPYYTANKDKIAHYFLQIAAIDTKDLVTRSENARALMIFLHKTLGEKLFEKGNFALFREVVQKANECYKLGPLKEEIPTVLDSVNNYVVDKAEGNLVKCSTKIDSPKEFVRELSENIPRLGGQYFDHCWMYMRWMTRPYPDLNVFNNFSIKDLEVPLTSFVRNVGTCLGFCSTEHTNCNDKKIVDEERKKITAFACELFPEDPLIVDFPFFILGRWVDGEELNIKTLKNHLSFWNNIFEKLEMSPILFEVASRYKQESSFEKDVRNELEKLKAVFKFEPYMFQLPKESGVPHYRPDFLLQRKHKNGKQIILEPHGIWTKKRKRLVRVANKTYTILAFPEEIDLDEKMFIDKMRVFRENYSEMYYLILIVPSTYKERVELEYPDIYDELHEDRDIPKLLYNLFNN